MPREAGSKAGLPGMWAWALAAGGPATSARARGTAAWAAPRSAIPAGSAAAVAAEVGGAVHTS